jgi:hypothetical protein
MTFYFLGVFAIPSGRLEADFTEAWPDADVIDLCQPFEGVAARLPERLHGRKMAPSPPRSPTLFARYPVVGPAFGS